MFFDVGLESVRVEFAPVSPAFFRGQRSRLGSGQITIDGAPPKAKAPGGLGFGTALVDEFHHPFPQIQCIGFQARKPISLCANVNMNCYRSEEDRLFAGTIFHDPHQFKPIFLGQMLDHVQRDASVELTGFEELVQIADVTQKQFIVRPVLFCGLVTRSIPPRRRSDYGSLGHATWSGVRSPCPVPSCIPPAPCAVQVLSQWQTGPSLAGIVRKSGGFGRS